MGEKLGCKMEVLHSNHEDNKKLSYLGTARRLLDGLILYRLDLGDAGRHLELLLRCSGVTASTDLPCTKRVH